MRYIERRQLTLSGRTIPYELERKTVKNINLRIRPDASVYVSANSRISLEHIEDFMAEKQHFILSTIDEIIKNQEKYPPCKVEEGETLYIAGKPYVLHIEEHRSPSVDIKGDCIHMYVRTSSQENRLDAYDMLLSQEGTILCRDSIARVFPLMQPYGIAMPEFHMRFMKSRWGSCLPFKKSIHLSTYLAIMPKPCIDQVVLHELCHLIHPNHSKAFYTLMTQLMPDWKERKEAMKKYMSYCL
ncbi:MAG: M48 family metallopeptidase [Megasphaera sp.]|jgi:predicted metal-dependent hydrolase|nr:M48 family metallopeptidase [Megasphaera sp.]